MYRRLNDKEKQLCRELAAKNWNAIGVVEPDISWDERKKQSIQMTKDDLRANREGFGDGRKGIFSSILTTFLLGLAVRFVIFLITKWWEGHFNVVNPHAEDVES